MNYKNYRQTLSPHKIKKNMCRKKNKSHNWEICEAKLHECETIDTCSKRKEAVRLLVKRVAKKNLIISKIIHIDFGFRCLYIANAFRHLALDGMKKLVPSCIYRS